MASLFGANPESCLRRPGMRKLRVFVQLRPRAGDVDRDVAVTGAERCASRARPNSVVVELAGPFAPNPRLVLGGAVRGGSQIGRGGTLSVLSSRPVVMRRLLVLSIL